MKFLALAILLTTVNQQILCEVIIIGPPGDQGVRGPPGERGSKGEGGAPGPMGARGAAGDLGDVGEPGKRSSQGETGRQGSRGYQGLQGPQGKTGLIGSKGAKGEAGEFGRMGRQGYPGLKGTTGVKGEKGFPGHPGRPGTKLRGMKGEMGDPGVPGRFGLPGQPGHPGNMGPPGNPGNALESYGCPCNAVDTETLARMLSAPQETVDIKYAYFFASLTFTLEAIPLGSSLLAFNNIIVNDGESYDSGSGIFTAPTVGIYLFRVSIAPTHGMTTSVVLRRLSVSSNVAMDVETYTCASGHRRASVLGAADPVIPHATQHMLQLDQGDK